MIHYNRKLGNVCVMISSKTLHCSSFESQCFSFCNFDLRAILHSPSPRSGQMWYYKSLICDCTKSSSADFFFFFFLFNSSKMELGHWA